MKYLDDNGLLYLVQKIKTWLTGKVDKVDGKGLSTNDLTNDLKAKYDTAVSKVDELTETGGAPNVIEIVKVNGTPLSPDSNKAVDIDVPTKISDLNNDDNTVKDAAYVHTDNNYTTDEKNKLAELENYDDTDIKNQIAQAGKIDTVKVNGAALTVTDKAVDITVPTNNNQLTNGAGYQTASEVEQLINNKVSSVMTYKGTVANYTDLPTNAATGDTYNITNSSDYNKPGDNAVWNGTNWDVLSGTIDLSNYYTKSEMTAITNGEIDTIVA